TEDFASQRTRKGRRRSRMGPIGRGTFQVGTRSPTEVAGPPDPPLGKAVDVVLAGLLAQATEELDGVMSDARLQPQRGQLIDNDAHGVLDLDFLISQSHISGNRCGMTKAK